MMLASFKLEPPPPAAQLRFANPVLDGFRELAFLVAEGPAALYHAISIPRIR